jgi:hypothetical protein
MEIDTTNLASRKEDVVEFLKKHRTGIAVGLTASFMFVCNRLVCSDFNKFLAADPDRMKAWSDYLTTKYES